MFKKMMKGLAIGGALMTMVAATSQAAQIEVNLYGASAQYKFWTAAAPEFLANGLGCDAGDVYTAADEDNHDRDAGIAVCVGTAGITANGVAYTGAGIDGTDFSSLTTGDTVVIRYTTNASYDGIRAVTEDANYDTDGCGFDMRLQADLSTVDFDGGETIGSLACMDVNIGASDVAATTFNQESHGYLTGPLSDGTDWDDRSVKYSDGDILNPADIEGFQVDQPIVVPFGFFANDDDTTPVPFDNLSRVMAVSLFNGQVLNWNEFDPDADDLDVVLCYRHAGSGTAATLDAAVMRGTFAVKTTQVLPTDFDAILDISPVIYFNKGSSDEMRCVGNVAGAVGYADVDKCIDGCEDKYGDVKSLTYQGVEGNTNTIANGQYIFWAAQYLYSNETQDGSIDNVIDALVDYASVEANLPSSKADYWSTQDAMNWTKTTDFAYPYKN